MDLLCAAVVELLEHLDDFAALEALRLMQGYARSSARRTRQGKQLRLAIETHHVDKLINVLLFETSK